MKALLLVAFLGALCVAQAAIIVRFNVADNAKTHRTPYRSGGSVQQTQALVVRGYDPVKIDATQDPFPADAEFVLFDDLSGLSPIGNGKKPAEWKVTANVAQDRKSLTFSWDQGTIGRFLFGIRSKGKLVYLSKSRIYILFNPWNSKDATAPTGADADKSNQFYVDLNEYVLNEFGAVWRGSATSNSPMAWNYGHLDLGVLDIVMGLLAPLAPSQRNAVLVSRFLTVAGQAVLEGRWPSDPNDYPGGNPPGFWTSSVQIIYQYNATGTVKYGQCWVFSSLYTALGRTLGLPTLSITNFDSAHEQQPFKQQCHMRYTGPQATFNRRLSTCSIWNFHVWNHVYIKRTDVPGASGWQAVDATPQETSSDGPKEAPFNEENYFTGPASLSLMRRGAYTTKYDTAFVGGESNAVVYRYHCSGNSVSSCTQSEVVTNQVGEKMYAKMPDSLTTSNVRQGNQGYSRIAYLNWARQYSNVSAFFIELENPKGQTQQQQQQQQASLQSGQSEQSLGSAHEANATEKGSVSFTVAIPSQLTLGNRFRVALNKKAGANLSGKWMLTLVVRSVDYMTGAAIGPDHIVVHQVVNDMATNRQGLVRRFGNDLWSNSTFLAALAKSSYLSFVFSAVPANSNHKLFLTVETVNVLRPTLPIICGTSPNPTSHKNTYNQGDIMHCVVKFFNPLKIAITGVKVQMTVSGLVAKEELKQIENQKQHKGLTQESVVASASDVDSSGQSVAGFRTIRVGGFQFALNATAGKQQISATFLSQQLRDVFGSNTITIKPNPNFAKSQSVQSKMESQAAKSDADADLGQTDAQVLQQKASATLQKAAKALDLAFQSKKASVGQFAKQVAKKITLVQHSKDTQKSKSK